jgi:hypothetical protein
VLLVHGGLWGDEDAEFFWHRPGVVGGLRERGIGVLAPDRPVRAGSWDVEAERLAEHLTGPVTVVARAVSGAAAAGVQASGFVDSVVQFGLSR